MNSLVAEAELRRIKSMFLEGMALPKHVVRPEVARSWSRVRSAGLRPGHHALFSNLSAKQDVARLVEKNHYLIERTEPEMQLLWGALGSPKWTILCIDPQGTILRSLGRPDLAPPEINLPLQPGRQVHEVAFGTTAPGCALAELLPVSVRRNEHFLDELTGFVCAATPIFDPFGSLAGVLDVTGCNVELDDLIVEHVLTTARSIENKMYSDLKECTLVSLHYLPVFLHTPAEGLLAVGEDGRMIAANRAARQMLDLKTDISTIRIESILDVGAGFKARSEGGQIQRAHLHSGRTLYIDIRPGKACSPRSRQTAITQSNAPGVVPNQAKGVPIFADKTVKTALDRASRAFWAGVPVLISGETGTGKELFAHALHDALGPHRPFVPINCAAIPESLIESELFGYVDGAFTGGRKGGAKGKLELANGGTLFLDEIGDMPLLLQTKLLRVLQERCVVRVGGNTSIPLDISVISASHRNLKDMLESHEFREDLYYRLNGLTVNLSPLRERSDIKELIDQFLREFGRPEGILAISPHALAKMKAYPWPGNVRQLQYTLQVAAALSRENAIIETNDFPDEFKGEFCHAQWGGAASDIPVKLVDIEKEIVLKALRDHDGNISATAKSLNISRTTLYKKMSTTASRIARPRGVSPRGGRSMT